jgi:LuxR family maltose regulon positive regulatory protein
MPAQVLATKLYIPPVPAAVRRPRLFERLDAGLQRKLTVVAAPAGFGKTTLVSAWSAGCGWPVAWLSLEEGDGDLARFLTYLAAAVRTVAPAVSDAALSALHSTPPPLSSAAGETILTALLNAVATGSARFVLVLDDYHLIAAPAVDAALAFLVEHLPPALRLVIATREDPPLPLARLRARGQLAEVRAADLRFTTAEAAEFLNQVMGLPLTAADIAALEARTEGWIAGLQMAALSLQGRADVASFIQAFTGSHHFVLDFLVEEVLARQPAPVRSFLLQTAILDRLTGKLCDAITGQGDGQARLEALQRGNFFLIPLDDARQWVRYHQLFADVLRTHLLAEQPELAPLLHQRASVWFEQNGWPAEAIRHALLGQDFARAAGLIELAIPELRRSRQEGAFLALLRALPAALVGNRPVLCVHYAGVLLDGGELEAAEAWLRRAEAWLAQPHQSPDREEEGQEAAMVVVDTAEFRRLPGWIAIYRAGAALAQGDAPATVEQAQRALAYLPEADDLGRGAATAMLGLAAWAAGDLEIAHRSFAAGMARVQKAGFLADAVNSAIALAEIRTAQGRLHEALDAYARGLQLATPPDAPILRGAADMHVGMSELYCEWGDFHAARQHLLQSQALGERVGMSQTPYRWHVAKARICAAQGDLDAALDLLDAAERLYVVHVFPNVRPLGALRARLWLAQGRLGAALGWARAQSLSAADPLSYRCEFEHITLARLLLAQQQSDGAEHPLLAALELLERLLRAAEAGGRTGSAIEILVLQALAQQMQADQRAQGEVAAALLPLQHALALAEPEGYIRVFVDEGPPMLRLLRAAASRGIRPAYTGLLLAAGEPHRAVVPPAAPAAMPAPPLTVSNIASHIAPLVEPLSERELQVLRLLPGELSGPEIAAELVVALSTVRTHTKHIFAKLGVNSRQAAVRRALELGLL